MVIVGKYKLERNENLDEYYSALGVPYIARKMMVMSSPVLDVSQEGDKWSIKSSTLLRTVESLFVPNEPYEETLPSGDILKSTSTLADNKIVTSSEVPNGSRTTRSYEFSEGGCVLLSYPWLPTPRENRIGLVRDYSDRSTLGHVIANAAINATRQRNVA
uniref:Lipocalin/cytosolic fatty-acid binding domain-containing protein n=1 Tax=Timema poppense TaxID=170557 RepID=A0A7R9DJW3_TIMPO|nr:unnamed protein product [Timema poppensis]